MDDTPEYLNAREEGCAKCSYKKRINNFSELKKGDHLCIDGQHVGCYCFCIRKSLNKHHAIVERVELIQRLSDQNAETTQQQAPDCARVHVIEYGQLTNQMKVRKHDYCIDLRLEPLRVWVVRYHPSKTFTPDNICEKANEKLENYKAGYALATNNCEHFCNDCCVGQKESRQVNTMCACLRRSACLGLDLIKLVRFFSFVAVLSSDDLLHIFKKEQHSLIMLVVLLFVYFVYTVLTCCGYTVCVCKPALKCCCGRIKCASCLSFVRKVACVKFIFYCFCQVGSFFCLLALVKMKVKHIIEVAFGIGCSLITLISLILIRRLMKHWHLKKKVSSTESALESDRGTVGTNQPRANSHRSRETRNPETEHTENKFELRVGLTEDAER